MVPKVELGESGVLLDGHGAPLAPVITGEVAGRKAMAGDG